MMAVEHQGQITSFKGLPGEASGATTQNSLTADVLHENTTAGNEARFTVQPETTDTRNEHLDCHTIHPPATDNKEKKVCDERAACDDLSETKDTGNSEAEKTLLPGDEPTKDIDQNTPVSDVQSIPEDQEFYVQSGMVAHLTDFPQDASPEEEISISFMPHVIDEGVRHKEIVSYGGQGDESPVTSEPVNKRLRLDFKLMNDGDIDVPEYTSSSQNHESLDGVRHNHFSKGDVHAGSIQVVDPQGDEGAILSEQVREQTKLPGNITLQIFPQSRDIHLVTTSSILSTDITTFSTQVPSILTEGDAEETEEQGNLPEQFEVVTTSSILTQPGAHLAGQAANIGVMATQTDFDRNVVLNDQQQVLITGIIEDGTSADQAIQINLPSMSEHFSNEAEEVENASGHVCPHTDCNTVCSKAHKLKLHMLSHSGERAYKCPQEGCEWSFATSYKLKRHIRGHTGERPFACTFEGCGKHFTTAYNLKAHIRVHYQSNTILCNHEGCTMAFSTLHKLHVHDRKHQAEEKPFKCQIEGCTRVFATASALTSHVRTHNGEKSHPCMVEGCGKKFTKASKLKLHLRSHTGERPFCCEMQCCDWSFTSAYKLKRHMRKHTGERPFTCPFEACNKSFTRSSHLKTHLLVHTGERPYACPVDGCTKSFTAGSTLNVHIRKHTGEKPFECDIDGCSKAYTTAANLRAHQKRHEHKETPKQVEQNSPEVEFVASSAMINESEVTYTTIQTFSEDFPSDVTPLSAACVQFTPSTSGLCALVTSADSPLISPTADSQGNIHVRVRQASHLDDGGVDSVNSETVQLPLNTGDHFVNVSLEDGTRIDVTEFVVRTDENEVVLNRARHRSEGSDTSGATPKHGGGFDLSISSMMRHLRGEALEGVMRSREQESRHAGVTLDLRTAVQPEDQFAPPAVIFQDEILKTPEQDSDGTVMPRSPETPTRATFQQSPRRISMPHDALQSHLPQTLEPAITSDFDKMSGHHSLSTTELTFGSPTSLLETHDEHALGKDGLSSYIDSQSSSEQDEVSGEAYPESTINLQDLR